MTTATTADYETTEGIDQQAVDALHRLLSAIADTKLMLGYHYGEWTFGTPKLEAAVANCSLSQSELGHVRLLHGVLQRHFGDDPDHLVDQRPSAEFASVGYLDGTIADWAGFVAMNAVVDVTVTAVLASLRNSALRPVRLSMEKMLDEERYHAHHGRGWFRTWAAQGEPAATDLGRRTTEALASMRDWLGPEGEPDDELLVSAGLKAIGNLEVYRAAEDDIRSLALASKVELATADPPVFDGWNPALRRATGAGPSEDIVYHLRGGANAIFKLSG